VKHIALLSVHSCPLAALGGKETGGMNVYIRELSREMGSLGLRVDVFTRSQNPHISKVVPLGPNVRVIHLKAGPEEPLPKNDLFHFLPQFTEGVIQFAGENKVSYDLVHSHYWLSGWVGEQLKRLWSIPLVHMFHTLGIVKNSVSRGKEEKESRRRLHVEREIMGYADGIIAPSPWEKKQMVKGYGAEPSKIRVIPCGVDLNLFQPIPAGSAKRSLGLCRKKFVLFVGRIDAVKGIDNLIRAIHHLSLPGQSGPEVRLIVIGGELDADPRTQNREMLKLRRLVARLNLEERVAFWGSQRQDLLPYFYSAAEALVLPSRYESFGMVVLEAMACGAAVIASRVGGLPYTVENGRTGFLIPEGDWQLLAARIREVIQKPALKKKLAQAAMSKVRQFSWSEITQKVLSFYCAVLEKKWNLKRS